MPSFFRIFVGAALCLWLGCALLVSPGLAVTIELDAVGTMSPRNQAAWWSPIVSRNGNDYVSYLSPNSPQDDVFVARRAAEGSWVTRDTGVNATYDVGHTQTSLAIDGQGFLHVAYGMHNNPMRLVTSNAAESISGGFSTPAASAVAAFAGGAYTYPNMTTAPNGDVYMIVRDQRSSYANQQGRLFRFDNVNRSWGELPPFAGQSGTTVYPDQILTDESGDLHILWEWAAGGAQAARHYGSYARFDPDTNTYYRANGAAYPVGAINIATSDVYQGLEGTETFAANVHGVQSAKLALDDVGRPLIAYGYSTTGTDSGYQHRFARWNGSEWTRTTVTQGPFDIEKPWIAYSDGILRYYGGVGATDPLYTGSDDIFVRTSTNLGESWSVPLPLTQGRNIQRPVGISIGSTDRVYLPSTSTETLLVADVTWDTALPEPPPDFPYFNTFASTSLVHQTSGFALDTNKGQLQYSAANGTLIDTATQAISDIDTSDFVMSTRMVINSVAGTNNLITLGLGAFGSSDDLLSTGGHSFYLADWSVNPHTSQGRLRILAQGDSSDFTAVEGDSDGANANGSSVVVGQDYELQLTGVHTGSALALTLKLFDAAGNQIGTPATAFDASPLAGKYFGFRNRIAGANHQIDASFDNFNLHAPLELPGDYDQNGTVDSADYVVWRDSLGGNTTLPNDDTAGVGMDDYDRWKANFGQSLDEKAGTISSVPEPGYWLLLALPGWVVCLGGRHFRVLRIWRQQAHAQCQFAVMNCRLVLLPLMQIVVLDLLACSAIAAKVVAHPRPEIDVQSKNFSLRVDDVAVDCIDTVMQVGYAHFSFSGRVRVELKASELVERFDLSPHRLGIKAKATGDHLTFWIDRPCKLHLRVNHLPRFFIFADRIERRAPDLSTNATYSLTDFDVTSSPKIVQTENIQRAINFAASRRGTLVVPEGVYLSGTLHLPSNLTLDLRPGAVIRGTTQLSDYPRGPGGLAQLRMEDAENVRICGRGVIDGNGRAMRAQFLPDRKRGRVKLLVAKHCRDVVVEDVILRDSGVWCIHPFESEHLRFRNLKIISVSRAETGPDTSHNTDAFDPDNSSNVLIDDNFISVDDDAIAVKLANGKRHDMSKIVFRNNVVWTTCAALKIGTEVFGHTVRNVVFQGNDIVHADSGIVVQCYRGGYVDGAKWIDNHFEQVGLIPNTSPHRKGMDIYVNSRSKDNFGEIRDLLLVRNVFERRNPRRSMIRGAGSHHIVENVVIDRLIIAGEQAASMRDARLHVDRDVQRVEFR